MRRTARPIADASPLRIAATPRSSWSKTERRGRRLRDRLLLDRRRDAPDCAATADLDLLLLVDPDLARWDDPALLRDRDGEDARVAMFVRLQDQRLDGPVTRRGWLTYCLTLCIAW